MRPAVLREGATIRTAPDSLFGHLFLAGGKGAEGKSANQRYNDPEREYFRDGREHGDASAPTAAR